VIRFGLRLTLSGGRDAAVRLILIAAAVAVGAGLLLVTLAGVNAVNLQNGRYAWLQTTASAQAPTSTWWHLSVADFGGQTIGRLDVAPASPHPVLPPGLTHLPAAGDYYASPALRALLRSTPADQLADRFPGKLAGTIGNEALPAPNSLVIIVGRTATQLSRTPGAIKVSRINTLPPSSCFSGPACDIEVGINTNGIDLIFSVVALALLFPVLIFIATATRLSAARREQRFAAMRLVGATPRQVNVIAAIESSVAAVVGTMAGFGLFFVFRPPLAAIPWDEAPFFTSDLSLSWTDILLVGLGVPVASAIAALLALRRVRISPLGVTRRVTPKPPRAWRVIPLLLGLAELGILPSLANMRADTDRQIEVFFPGFVLVMAGLLIAGPWLTMAGSALMARRTSRPATLIAARRLADNPKASFRAISGLILALFIASVAVAVITTQNVNRGGPPRNGSTASLVVTDQFETGPSQVTVAGSLLAKLAAVPGVTGLAVARVAPASTANAVPGFPFQAASFMSCAQLARVPALGHCPMGSAGSAGSAVALLPPGGLGSWQSKEQATQTWPAATISTASAERLPANGIFVATNGSAAAIERAQTILGIAYPDSGRSPTLARYDTDTTLNQYQQLADVVICVSIPIAGCTLAASVAGGLSDRKRPFSLLRLTGAPLRLLQGVVTLESAVPLIVVALLSIGAGFAASAMFLHWQMQYALASPGLGFFGIMLAALVLALAIVAATFPLLARITGPETARNE
jgi:FtsX-like permease family